MRDINGDNRPDLIVLTEGTGIYNDVFGTSSTGRYWKAYLNTGSGFATAAINWALPSGGYINGHDYSFNTLENNTYSQIWSVLDLNGDNKADLVVLTENGFVFGTATSSTGRYWRVYLNTGTGFATTAISWTLPLGGHGTFTSGGVGGGTVYFYSFDWLAGTGASQTGAQSWAVRDLNGDSQPDLVILTEQGINYNEPFGTGTSRSWKVYLNAGTGFSSTAITWPLPAGGLIDFATGHLYSFNALAGAGSALTGNQAWAIQDLNGDTRPDLIVLSEGNGTYNDVFGTGTSRYWKVYLSTGSGFATNATTWALPPGGYTDSAHAYSFALLASANYSSTIGSQTWAVLDINGDTKSDLVV
ncbi:MAG: VCBS repeat-containing protein, partial [Hymenobacter sp.]